MCPLWKTRIFLSEPLLKQAKSQQIQEISVETTIAVYGTISTVTSVENVVDVLGQGRSKCSRGP